MHRTFGFVPQMVLGSTPSWKVSSLHVIPFWFRSASGVKLFQQNTWSRRTTDKSEVIHDPFLPIVPYYFYNCILYPLLFGALDCKPFSLSGSKVPTSRCPAAFTELSWIEGEGVYPPEFEGSLKSEHRTSHNFLGLATSSPNNVCESAPTTGALPRLGNVACGRGVLLHLQKGHMCRLWRKHC